MKWRSLFLVEARITRREMLEKLFSPVFPDIRQVINPIQYFNIKTHLSQRKTLSELYQSVFIRTQTFCPCVLITTSIKFRQKVHTGNDLGELSVNNCILKKTNFEGAKFPRFKWWKLPNLRPKKVKLAIKWDSLSCVQLSCGETISDRTTSSQDNWTQANHHVFDQVFSAAEIAS